MPSDADLARHVASLDLPTKVRLLTGATTFTLWPEPSIGLDEVRLSDGPTGVRGLKFSGGRTVALFPNATLLASAWSEDVATEVGHLLAEEALAQEVHVVLGPTINLHRTPLGGRLFEAYSEDPLLTGRLAAAYVRGMQADGVGACLKHLVANESETERNTVNSVVDESTLRELYLLPFEIAVDESDPWTVMAAYNDVNGVAATEQHHVNVEILKGEWGYRGLVMSDWFATKTAAAAANGGLDLVMPGPDGPWGDALLAAVSAGDIAESTVDDHVHRLLVLAARVGALGAPRRPHRDLPAPDGPERREQLRRLAAGGITVLVNRDEALPLEQGRTVALIGRHAVETSTMGGGSAQVNAPYHVSVAEGLTALLGDGLTVTDGVDVRTRPVPARPEMVTDPETGRPGVGFSLLDADGSVLERRHSALSTTLVGFDDDVEGIVRAVRVEARLELDGEIELGVMGVGSWRMDVGGQELSWELATSGGGIGEEVLSPPVGTGRLTVRAGDLVTGTVTLRAAEDADSGPMAGVSMVALVARPAPRDEDDVIEEAAAAAAAADVAVVVVGLTDEQETEAVDKTTLRLPGRQDDLVLAVAAAARRTVVVVNAATPVLMPWLDRVDAVLWAGLPGQEGGHAVAATLVGDLEPAGRLVTTFPVEDEACPAWSVTPVAGDLVYAEGTFIGYRGHHAGRVPEPAFWFGHGLGYSTWDYGQPRLVPGRLVPAVAVEITNTGTRESREVVQVYLRPAEPDQPVRLVGWAAVTVAPGDAAEMTIQCEPRMWRRWDAPTSAWSSLADGGELVVARGLGDVRGRVTL